LTVESLASVGRNEEAQATIRKFLEVDPNNEYALRRLVLMLVQGENIDQAQSLLNERIEKKPDTSLLYSLRSSLWLTKASTGNPGPEERKGWLESAKGDCDKAIELDAENLDAFLNRARICLALKDYEQAKKDVDYLQQKRPDIPDLAFLKMDIAIQEKRIGDAIAELERLVQLNPENRMLLMQLAQDPGRLGLQRLLDLGHRHPARRRCRHRHLPGADHGIDRPDFVHPVLFVHRRPVPRGAGGELRGLD
jgi:predicted Zn-dependent protease